MTNPEGNLYIVDLDKVMIKKTTQRDTPDITIDTEGIDTLLRNLKMYRRWIEDWSYIINYYADYGEEKIKERLDEDEKNWDKFDYDEHEYRLGGQYSPFIEDGNVSVDDENDAAQYLSEKYKKIRPDHTLEFDPESSHCHIYTKSREEAEHFLKWVFDEYIKPKLVSILGNVIEHAEICEVEPEKAKEAKEKLDNIPKLSNQK